MNKLCMTLPKIIIFGGLTITLSACQSASQSSSSNVPVPPSSPSSSPSSQSSQSMPSPSQSSQSSQSMPSPSQSSGSQSSPSTASASSAQSGSSAPGPNSSSAQAPSSGGSAAPTISSSSSQNSGQGAQGAMRSGQPSVNASFPSGSVTQSGPGENAGTQSRLPPDTNGDDSFSRDTTTGDLNSAGSGETSALGGIFSEPGGDFSLDTLPNGVLSGNIGPQSQNRGTMTAAERAEVLDDALRRGYETFDGFILSERERAQNESNAAGSAQPGGEAGGGGASAQVQPQILIESGTTSGTAVSQPSPSTQRESNQTFPPPEDIPSGRDDDVVARQLREAAMSEPDPELREALWDEYRNYTGISEGNEQ